ncbi:MULTISPECIES: helix-turn-helix domain-containing protein [unclassified Mycobacterium]|uniref:helix-turn-helix domain-containing protein n=1 Tax=unclassified Mycobacterium TaxID=2642494 RepID=UPI0029C78397|nr:MULTISPECIES: helix-turn-helix domain-containing protein [unclassified Mycobacterium]
MATLDPADSRKPAATRADDAAPESVHARILHAATRRFSVAPFAVVSVEEIADEARVAKASVYGHFGSKDELALAVIEDDLRILETERDSILVHGLPGLESLIDVMYAVAVHDLTSPGARARVRLLDSIDRVCARTDRRLDAWVAVMAAATEHAIAQQDFKEWGVAELTRFLASMYFGLQKTLSWDEPETFLRALQRSWSWTLPGLLRHERLPYFVDFLERRTTHAIAITHSGRGG